MGAEEGTQTHDRRSVNAALTRLYFNELLDGSSWLSPAARRSIDRTVHYGYVLSPPEEQKSLGGLIDGDPNYVADACGRVFADKKEFTQEEFLALFLNLLLAGDRNQMLELSRTIDDLVPDAAEIFKKQMENYLLRHQIPAVDLCVALGIYVLQKAQDQGIIDLTDKVKYKR